MNLSADSSSNPNDYSRITRKLAKHWGIEFQCFIARGTYANVLKARATDGTRVALKIIDSNAKTEYTHRFLPREKKIWPQLHHFHVVQVYEMIEISHFVVFVCEFAENGNLLGRIKRDKKIDEPDAQRFTLQIINALEYLHGRWVVHRDLKCENIFLDRNDNIKIGDFGFARTLLKCEDTVTFCGSRAYAPPEILQAIPYSAFSSDVWSLGVVIYIMVTGCMPYDDNDVRKMLQKQISRKIRFPENVAVSTEAKQCIYDIVHPNPNARPTLKQICESSWLKNVVYFRKAPEL